jgi:hypothetical protein
MDNCSTISKEKCNLPLIDQSVKLPATPGQGSHGYVNSTVCKETTATSKKARTCE